MQHQEFEELDFEKQCKIVAQSSFAEKTELILRTQHPEKIIGSITPEEAFMILKNTEEQMLPDLLQLATIDQIIFMSDMECWKNDRLSRKKFIGWLDYLLEAGVDKLWEWLNGMDFELLVTGFKKNIKVLKAPPEEAIDEYIGDMPCFSIDMFYYISCREEYFDTIKKSLEVVFMEDKELYLNLMEAMLSEIESEMEEDAFQMRQERLSESGFPERDVAFRIYAPLKISELASREQKDFASAGRGVAASSYLNAPAVWDKDKLFLDDALAALSSHDRQICDHIQAEIAGISNKVIVCKGMERFDETLIKWAVCRARHYLNIGLEAVAKGDILKGAECLCVYWAEDLFRTGFSQILMLRERASELLGGVMKPSLQTMLKVIDPPYDTLIHGILSRHPLWYDSSLTGEASLDGLRDFMRLGEIKEAGLAAKDVHEVLKSLMDNNCLNLNEIYNMNTYVSADDIKAGTILITIFANYVLKGKSKLTLVLKKQAGEFFSRVFIEKDGKRMLKPKIVEEFLVSFGGINPENRFARHVFSRFAEEFAYVMDVSVFDPRYHTLLLVRK